MRFKRLLIRALVCLNLLLLTALLLMSFDLPEAFAQGAGRGGKYAVVSAQYTGGTDALYILHTKNRVLTVLVPAQNQSGRLVLADSRNVAADLGG